MATPRQARAAGSTKAPASSTKARDKGTRGGRPEPAVAGSAVPKPRPRQAAAQPGRPPRPAPEAAPAGPDVRVAPRWLQFTTWVLALAGLGVSVYLTIVHYNTAVQVVCPATGHVNCEKVITSPQSVIFGIPVAVYGLAFYVFLIVAASPWAWRATGAVGRALTWARLASVVVGMVFVLYLIYTELFTLNLTICLWCTAVHVITFMLFGLIVFAAAAGYGIARAPARR